MTTQSLPAAAKTSITISLDSLASATYVAGTAVDVSSIDPLDIIVEMAVVQTATASSGNKRTQVFIQTSLDGTNYSTGPTSGTTTTDEPDLYKIGDVPCNVASTTHRKAFSVLAAIGWVPPYFKLICHNDLGTALSTGCTAHYTTVTGNSA
ncbi:MAG: hypothetical protein IPN11_14535 [Opitutaceae bacterium]|nr:hypothetical protein [Opitutaceae bacterium]